MKSIYTIVLAILLINPFILGQKIVAPADGCYHSAFTGNDTHANFEQLAKKQIAIEMFFTGWPTSKIPDFPDIKCNEIAANGAVPHITWMPQISGSPYPLDAILTGLWDSYIRGYAVQAKQWGKPLFIRYGHEMNGDWYYYGGANNGAGKKDGYGDPNLADGPERFVDSYKRIWTIFNQQGVTNVTWIWCPNNGSSPSADWNKIESYYPGDQYVDWVGMDGYNFGNTQSFSAWTDFIWVYNSLYNICKLYEKPIMIGEFASVENGGNKAKWITDAYNYTKILFTKIKAITWFHIRKTEGTVDTDWRINSSATALTAYQNAIADPYFVSSVQITGVKNEVGNTPVSFELKAAYPNPFNPITNINYSLAEGGLVSIKVFNVLGREVFNLVNEFKPSGTYSTRFEPGRLLNAGVYFIKLQSGNKTAMQKVIYLK